MMGLELNRAVHFAAGVAAGYAAGIAADPPGRVGLARGGDERDCLRAQVACDTPIAKLGIGQHKHPF